MAPSTKEILSASAGWVAATLNIFPGLGTGYIYQRRWKQYWITAVIATGWFIAGALLGGDDKEIQNQLIGFLGLLILGIATSIEAGYSVKKSREKD